MAEEKRSKGEPRKARRARDPLDIPAWLPPALFATVTLLLFREFVFSDQMLRGGDTESLGYMARAFYARALGTEGFPLWNPLILGGTPFIEALSGGDSLYPSALLLLIMEPHRALGWKLVLHIFLAGVFMYGWVRVLGRSKAAALLSGMAYSLAPFLVSFVRPGHDGKIFVISLTPLMFWAMERTFRRAGLRPFVVLAAVIGLVILTTHFQLAYFLFGASGLYYAFRSWEAGWRGREAEGGEGAETPRGAAWAGQRYALFLAAALVGAGVAAVQLIPAADYVLESSRRTATTTLADEAQNRAYGSSWGLHPEEVMSYIVPEFAGNASGGAPWAGQVTGFSYWGRNQFKDNHEAAGFMVLLLAIIGLVGTPRRRLRWFLGGVGVVALLYALSTHTPVWGLFYALMPGVSLFRAPSMVSFLFGFSLVTLMAFGVDRLIQLAQLGEKDEGGGKVALASWIVSGLVGLGLLLAASGALYSIWLSVVYPTAEPFKLQILETHKTYILRGFFMVTVMAGLTTAIVAGCRRGTLKPLAVVAVLGLLVFVDGFRISSAFILTQDFEAFDQPDPIASALMERQAADAPFRVADFSRGAQEVKLAQHGLELATGHHPNDLARYRELIGMQGSQIPTTLLHQNVLPLLNVRYLVWADSYYGQPAPVENEPILQTQLRGQVHQSLYEFPTLPRARLVGSFRVVPEDQTVPTILGSGFDPRAEVLLTEEPPLPMSGADASGEVEWEEKSNNVLRWRVRSDSNALLVVSDNWYSGWKATVDGDEAPVMRAYHTLRAVPVPAGESIVEMRYDSALLKRSLWVSLLSATLLVGVGVAATLTVRKAAVAASAGSS